MEIRAERADGPAGRALLMACIADARVRIGECESPTPPTSAEAMAPAGGAFPDTSAGQPEARALYLAAGFTEVPRRNEYAAFRLEKRL